MTYLRRSLLIGMIACMPVYSHDGHAQSSQDTASRIRRLENEIDTLSRAVFKGQMPENLSAGAGGAGAQANVELRLSQMEGEVRALTGKLEQYDFQIRQMQERLDRSLGDLEMRVSDQEARLNAAASSAAQNQSQAGTLSMPPQPSSQQPAQQPAQGGMTAGGIAAADGASSPFAGSAPEPDIYYDDDIRTGVAAPAGATQQATPPIPDGPTPGAAASNLPQSSATESYDRAFSYLREKDYANAESAFQTFLKGYPDHALAENAQYWLGETYYVRGDYEQAARVFAEAYQKYPQGAKAGDNLLKLALSLSGQNKTADACVAFAQLKKQFGSTPSPILSRADREIAKLSCSL